MTRQFSFIIQGKSDTMVTIEEGDFSGDGFTDLKFTLEVTGGRPADLRGLFWDIEDNDPTGWFVYEPESPDVTGSQFQADSVTDLGQGANINGKHTNKGREFDAGVRFGTPGNGSDDIQSTSFVITGGGEDLSLDEIGGERFGLRTTSPGDKVVAIAPNAPDAGDDEYTQEVEDTVVAGNVLDNDMDDDGDSLAVVAVNGSDLSVGSPVTLENGILTVDADGGFQFTPTTSFVGEQTFEYTVSDGEGGSDSAEVTIIVNEVAGITVDLQDGLAIDTGALILSADDGASANIMRGPDGTVSLELSVAVPDLPEVVDIVLAQDLSGSFFDDLPVLQAGNFVTDLLSNLSSNGADDVGFGIASYVDYPIFSLPDFPFGDPFIDFIYNTDQPITTDASIADGVLDTLITFNGVDAPEAQLVALQQIALRADGEIGFRPDAQRFVVLSTDAPYHLAGDYTPGGLNDNDTDLSDGLGIDGIEDYPSIEQLAAALSAADITPIFTVTNVAISTYEWLLVELNAIDPTIGGAVVELSSDSSNLQDAIIAGIRASTTDVALNVLSDDFGFIESVTPSSFTDVNGPSTVTFNIEIANPTDYADDVVSIEVPGFGSVDLNFDFGLENIDGTVGRDTLSGNGNANVIDGGERADIINGEGGDDRLIGGAGNDQLTGGSGADTFVLENALFRGTDELLDYEDGVDQIELSGYVGLSFVDLTIVDDGLGNAEVSVGDGNSDDPIAVVIGVPSVTLDAGDFIFS